ncbi:MAG: hypothetical protein NC311_07285 [Muribaculaceae bacterium]|nr:hypothetical protein [Muribaculum sp.]MCM1295330.1 hypothetical protein [Muribaculaceae bacterium]
MKVYHIFLLLFLATAVSGCSKLSPEAKKITGTYYNVEISRELPVMELNKNATCVVRAVRPGVLTYEVEGTWNVENDSLIMTINHSTLHLEGDSSLVGNIPTKISRKIIDCNEFSLQLEHDGVTYIYQRQ